MVVMVTDIHIGRRIVLDPPKEVATRRPTTERVRRLILDTRTTIEKIIDGTDPRMLAVVGPCSIHDKGSALLYARKLIELQQRVGAKFLIIMRACFHKPRTVSGPGNWEGLYLDPGLDGSLEVQRGIEVSRDIALSIMELGMPIGSEILDSILVQYMPPLPLAWIGARTVQNPDLRKLASGLSAPCGFKNTTSGDIGAAIDAAESARHQHRFNGVDAETGRASLFEGTGNRYGFVILRGGHDGPNYDLDTISQTVQKLRARGLPPYVMIDASHGNSNKDHRRQSAVVMEATAHARAGFRIGIMVESHLKEGKQAFTPGPSGLAGIEPDISITDACMSWDATVELLLSAASVIPMSTS